MFSAADCGEYRQAAAAVGEAVETGRSPHLVKVKNPQAPAVKREAEDDWGRWLMLLWICHDAAIEKPTPQP
jgi:hypothetical protein